MSNSSFDIGYEEYCKITICYNDWLELAQVIKFDRSSADKLLISKIREIEDEIKSVLEDNRSFYDFMTNWEPLSKENIDQYNPKQETRKKDPEVEFSKMKLRKRDFKLKEEGFTSKKRKEILAKEFPKWTISTIETYLKRD